MTAALKHYVTNSSCETDGKRHASHKFNLNTPDDHLIDTNLGGYKLAEGIFDGPGKFHDGAPFAGPSDSAPVTGNVRFRA